nr:hypothetical protein [Tyzzerella sp. An114]
MKRELGIARCGLACCLCSENVTVVAVIQVNVQIRTGVKIEDVQFLKNFHIVMNVMKNVEKDY